MALKFKAVPRKNPRDLTVPAKYYAQIVNKGEITLRPLAEEIADISTVSNIDSMASIEGFIRIVPKQLGLGNIVKMGDFGTFRLTLNSEGVATPEDLTSAHIKKYTVHFRPGKLFKQVLDTADYVKG
jgi:predicted histone-like DNA-binding protein